MNKDERQNYILQLIQQSDGQLLGTSDLAEQLGVSKMTVRRDLEELSQEGRLHRHFGGAVPSRQIPNHRRKEIGILLVSRTGKYSDPFYNALLEGVDRKLTELDYRIAYISTRMEVNTADQVRQLLQQHTVSGIILIGPPMSAESLAYLKSHMRYLVGTTGSLGSDYDAVTFDGYTGIRLMVDHLVKLGYRRPGFITGLSDRRQKGFADAVAAHGVASDPELTVVVPFGIDGWTRELGHTGAEQLMRLPQPPDVIVCASDLIAIGAIQWLHQHNLRVPDDIAVTGFDDIEESAFTIPPLTTVHVHKQLMGELAAECIVKRIENLRDIPLYIQTPVHLVIRASCGHRK
jgi:DNA-binding LacI/PurR family transcriptional regulator